MKRIIFVCVSLVAILLFKASLYLDGTCTGEGDCLDQLTLASQKGDQVPGDAATDANMEFGEGGASEPSSMQSVHSVDPLQNLVDSEELGQWLEFPTDRAVPGIQQIPDELNQPAVETLPQAGLQIEGINANKPLLSEFGGSGLNANSPLLSQLHRSGLDKISLQNSQWSSFGEFANSRVTSQEQLQKSEKCRDPFLPRGIDWAAYFEKVYHQSLPKIPPKAANEFEWFYYTLYDESSRKKPDCMSVLQTENEAHPGVGMAWTVKPRVKGLWCSPRCPVNKVPSYGFFVKRESRTGYDRQSRIEVLHAAYPEGKLSWFWPVKGTGVFINLNKMRKLGQVVENQYMEDIGKYMYEKNVMVLIRPKGVYWMPEVIVRMSLGKGACVLPNEMLSTGFTNPLPCVCNNSEEILNCNG